MPTWLATLAPPTGRFVGNFVVPEMDPFMLRFFATKTPLQRSRPVRYCSAVFKFKEP